MGENTAHTPTDPTCVPVFEKDNNQFIVIHTDFIADDENGAWEIGIGASLVECILWGARFTGKTRDLKDDFPYRESTLYRTPIALISGPLFDEAE